MRNILLESSFRSSSAGTDVDLDPSDGTLRAVTCDGSEYQAWEFAPADAAMVEDLSY